MATKAPVQERALVSADPFRRFLAEVQRYPLLTEAEERELAERFRATGDVEAARRLVTSHLRLVVKIAMEYRSAYYNILDLVQEGNVGLMIAVKKFDPDKGARLSYYASWWIRSYILKYILENFRLIKIGTTKAQRRLFYRLVREKQRIEAMGFAATSHLIAGRLGVTPHDVEEMTQRIGHSEVSLDAPIGHESRSASLGDFIADNDVPIDEKLAQTELKDLFQEKLREFVQTLKPREVTIFRERLLAEVPRTLQDIADEFGISKERARQLEARIIEKLRDSIRATDLLPARATIAASPAPRRRSKASRSGAT
ncbi:MAG: RNA polymerase factor sigma-32 [Deltaproteobacteria bacterium]|nr:RNA polymerase factor sigma-32 [Deltaproteobacteria bacterium]